jgi:hypothetical protein
MATGGVYRAHPQREPLLLALFAGSLAAALAWAGPPGTDFAAHAYQRAVYLDHGFQLWNNFWYAGHYSFVTYSLLYYPLAGLLGIKLLAVATAAIGTLAFAVLLAREWGPRARYASVAFAAVWGTYILTAAFPFALGLSLALLAVCALQSGSRSWFALLVALTLGASPLAFLLMALVLAGIALCGNVSVARMTWPALTVAGWALVEVVLWRAFPSGGLYPFSSALLLQGLLFCAAVVLLTWRIEAARPLSFIFLVLAAGCVAAYAVPSGVGQNMIRFRFVALPVMVLALSLRHWRPWPVAVCLLALATWWNLSPLASSFGRGETDPAGSATYWQPAIGFLKAHLTPSYRVEVVGTARHWEAAYLPRAGIPITRGWFRQDDFPQNEVLYGPLSAGGYLDWLHALGVRYVVLTSSPPDYSARREAALIRSGRIPLQPVFRGGGTEVLQVPAARRMISGNRDPRVLSFSQARFVVRVRRGGYYRMAVRYSPYWTVSSGCISRTRDGMVLLAIPKAETVSVSFLVSPARAFHVLTHASQSSCTGQPVT